MSEFHDLKHIAENGVPQILGKRREDLNVTVSVGGTPAIGRNNNGKPTIAISLPSDINGRGMHEAYDAAFGLICHAMLDGRKSDEIATLTMPDAMRAAIVATSAELTAVRRFSPASVSLAAMRKAQAIGAAPMLEDAVEKWDEIAAKGEAMTPAEMRELADIGFTLRRFTTPNMPFGVKPEVKHYSALGKLGQVSNLIAGFKTLVNTKASRQNDITRNEIVSILSGLPWLDPANDPPPQPQPEPQNKEQDENEDQGESESGDADSDSEDGEDDSQDEADDAESGDEDSEDDDSDSSDDDDDDSDDSVDKEQDENEEGEDVDGQSDGGEDSDGDGQSGEDDDGDTGDGKGSEKSDVGDQSSDGDDVDSERSDSASESEDEDGEGAGTETYGQGQSVSPANGDGSGDGEGYSLGSTYQAPNTGLASVVASGAQAETDEAFDEVVEGSMGQYAPRAMMNIIQPPTQQINEKTRNAANIMLDRFIAPTGSLNVSGAEYLDVRMAIRGEFPFQQDVEAAGGKPSLKVLLMCDMSSSMSGENMMLALQVCQAITMSIKNAGGNSDVRGLLFNEYANYTEDFGANVFDNDGYHATGGTSFRFIDTVRPMFEDYLFIVVTDGDGQQPDSDAAFNLKARANTKMILIGEYGKEETLRQALNMAGLHKKWVSQVEPCHELSQLGYAVMSLIPSQGG